MLWATNLGIAKYFTIELFSIRHSVCGVKCGETFSEKNRVHGYFIDKVMFDYTPRISQFIERNSTEGVKRCLKFRPELFDAFHKFFADAVWIYIERRDVFAHAVSIYLGETTQIWERRLGLPLERFGEVLEDGPPAYN